MRRLKLFLYSLNPVSILRRAHASTMIPARSCTISDSRPILVAQLCLIEQGPRLSLTSLRGRAANRESFLRPTRASAPLSIAGQGCQILACARAQRARLFSCARVRSAAVHRAHGRIAHRAGTSLSERCVCGRRNRCRRRADDFSAVLNLIRCQLFF